MAETVLYTKSLLQIKSDYGGWIIEIIDACFRSAIDGFKKVGL